MPALRDIGPAAENLTPESQLRFLSRAAASLENEVLDQQKAEQELLEAELRYRRLFEESPLAMLVFDAGTLEFLDVNAAAQQLYGYTREELLEMTLRDTWSGKEASPGADVVAGLCADSGYTNTFVTQQKTGKLLTVEMSVRSIDFGGRKARLALITDVTEQKRLESLLRQSQKMEAVGNLAGGIAHDFNNLLTVILGYSDNILRKLDRADPLHSKVAEIQSAGRRAANLTSELLAFSRQQILKPELLDLNSVAANVSQTLDRLLGDDIQICLHLDANLGQVQADPAQLEHVLVNLALNARDAMPKGGQVVIETHNVDLSHQAATLQGIPPGRYVLLVVSDTGCGMDEITKARVFEPFFTTKGMGKSKGLGLAMVFGVVKQSGGTVTVYSEIGLGSTFKIYLPRVDAPAPRAEQSKESQAVYESNGATILLVEDEPSLRALGHAILQEAGYAVLEASNGKEALRLADSLGGPPDLLLTDVVMPEMGGLELAEHLQGKWPGLSVVYTSGYTDHALLERNALRKNSPFLQKPYMPTSLLDQVGSVLERKSLPAVLIVDDDRQVRQQLRGVLEHQGYPVFEAEDGHTAMALIGEHPVKLIVTDLVMPSTDGIEMIRQLRQSHADVKIVAISEAFGRVCLEAAANLGADVVLTKPFANDELLRAAKRLLAA